MYSSVNSCAMVGVEPRPVRIETTVVGSSRAVFVIVGLPDAAVRESRERVRAAIQQQGFRFPAGRVVVNLSPAEIPKVGATYDFPVALSIIAATSESPVDFGEFIAVGELSLEGRVRPVRTALAALDVALQQGKRCLVAHDTPLRLTDAGVAAGVSTLREAFDVARGRAQPQTVTTPITTVSTPDDLGLVRGQEGARRALEISAAGGHHLLLSGPPGAGKTMLARCLPGILPPLPDEAEREVALIWSAAGLDRSQPGVPPFRSPHHSASLPALVGGGIGIPRPGEVSKAHQGVLFLDELGEFPPSMLDALRQPVEDGVVTVARAADTISFPARFQLVAATNPCPCGYDGDYRKPCVCTDGARDRYRRRLSGPLVDRFDLRLVVPRLRPTELAGAPGEASAAVRARVCEVRAIQRERGSLNRELRGIALEAVPLTDGAARSLRGLADADEMTGRGWDRIRRVARTIADMDGSDVVRRQHVEEAAGFRGIA